jgi:hypothetical protein
MDVITKPYHLSEVTTFKISKRHSILINSVTLFIHQAYNNRDLSATIVMMTKKDIMKKYSIINLLIFVLDYKC